MRYIAGVILIVVILISINRLFFGDDIVGYSIVEDSIGNETKPTPANKKNILLPIAILAAAVGYSLMSFIMTATPLQIVNICKLGNSASSTVIQWHIIAMFAPSFFTGSIISRFGNRKVMLVGIILYAFSVFFGILGDTVLNFWIALFLCGLGWNFLYVGGSDIIAKSALPEERAKVQGVTDFIIFIFVAMGSFLAGYLHSNLGWEIMLFYTIVPILLIFIGIIIIKPQNLKLN